MNWEYRRAHYDHSIAESVLRANGDAGWELVLVDVWGYAVFKRPLDNAKKATNVVAFPQTLVASRSAVQRAQAEPLARQLASVKSS